MNMTNYENIQSFILFRIHPTVIMDLESYLIGLAWWKETTCNTKCFFVSCMKILHQTHRYPANPTDL